MATEIIMPKLGLTMTEGTIVRWLKEEGQVVQPGEPLLEIETDKVTLEVEAPAGGTLLKILVEAGETVPLTHLIGYIGRPDEPLPAVVEAGLRPAPTPAPTSAPTTASSPAEPPLKVSPIARRLAQEHQIDLATIVGRGPQGRIVEADVQAAIQARQAVPPVKASPIAKKLAREHNIDLAGVRGSGPEGRIVEADIQRLIAAGQAEEPFSVPYELYSPAATRRLAARRLAESFQTAPHFYLRVELVAGRLVELRQRLLPELEAKLGLRLTYTDLLLRALALTLPDHPLLNASWVAGQIRTFTEVHLGVAIAAEQGLVVGVIHRAEALSLAEIAEARARLAGKARQGKLAPPDVAGGTFTLTNLGMFGIDDFMPILNPPQSAILAAGAIAERPVGENGQLVLRPTLCLSLAIDHRVADGVDGARFLADLRTLLERPDSKLA
jgi:pyruvate dehydrogenase E2 component (dihydrolipoamide acetyltransferase)